MIEKVIPFSHRLIKSTVTDEDITLDMTMGKGNDTLLLAQLSKHVYAFDIQEQALHITNDLLSKHNISNVTLIKDSHINVLDYYKGDIKCAVFNLGYLPGGDKSITTKHEDTIHAIESLLPLLVNEGLIIITVYPGHKSGDIESTILEKFIVTLDSKEYNVVTYKFVNKNKSPYNIIIEKN